jgi:hypothetical protein
VRIRQANLITRRHSIKLVKGMDLMSPEEKFILERLRTVANLIGRREDHREYQRRGLYARRMVAKGDVKAAEAEFEVMRTKFPTLWKMGKLLLRVYQEGFHDGAHQAAMRHYDEGLAFRDPVD